MADQPQTHRFRISDDGVTRFRWPLHPDRLPRHRNHDVLQGAKRIPGTRQMTVSCCSTKKFGLMRNWRQPELLPIAGQRSRSSPLGSLVGLRPYRDRVQQYQSVGRAGDPLDKLGHEPEQ